MKKIVSGVFFIFTFLLSDMLFAQSGGNVISSSTVSCYSYLDASPLTRSSGYGEENIINGLYSGLAQRYNNLSGSITGVRFWARVPTSVGTSQTVKVMIYQENVGFPGTLLSQTTVMVPSSDSLVQIDAPFASAVNVNSNIIIAVEPFSIPTNNVWIKHNQEGNASNNYIGDGDNLYLNLIKQGVTWYKELANGDPSWDYDFMILPLSSVNVTSGFSSSMNNYVATFSNTSVNAVSYMWDFGDGNTSTQTSPSHTYSATGTFMVKLKSFGPGSTCYDSIVQPVNVSLTGLFDIDNSNKGGLNFHYSSVNNLLTLEAVSQTDVQIYNVAGTLTGSYQVEPNTRKEISLQQFADGIYFINTPDATYKFIKQ